MLPKAVARLCRVTIIVRHLKAVARLCRVTIILRLQSSRSAMPSDDYVRHLKAVARLCRVTIILRHLAVLGRRPVYTDNSAEPSYCDSKKIRLTKKALSNDKAFYL
jgi:hypothetical protein